MTSRAVEKAPAGSGWVLGCRRTPLFVLLLAALAVPFAGGALLAQPCIVPDNGTGTVDLPPAGCGYVSPDDLHMIIDGLPAGTTIRVGAEHSRFFAPQRTPLPGGGEREQFQSFLMLTMEGTGELAAFSKLVQVPAQCVVETGPRTPGAPVQDFDAQMMSLQGQIIGDPDFDLLRITAGTGFGLPSPGHTTLTQLPGGNWAVDSFFDITYRIDFVGGPGGPLAGRSGSTTGTIRMGTGGGAGDECPPPAGEDVVETKPSEAKLDVDIPGAGAQHVVLRGEVTTRRLTGPTGEIQTEILQMSLTGNHPVLGDVMLRESPTRASTGRLVDVQAVPVAGGAGDPECAGDGFFDVFVEASASVSPNVLHNEVPIRVEGEGIPVRHTRTFQLVQVGNPIPLLDAQNRPTGITIANTCHIVNPPPPPPPCFPPAGMDLMDSVLLHDIDIPGIGLCQANLRGPVKVNRSDPRLDPATGLTCIDTEIVELNLQGVDPICGRICITLNPFKRSLGRICEKVPGTCFPANSWFNVYVKVELKDLGICFYACEAAMMHCMIDQIPPYRCLYNLNIGQGQVVPLYRGPCDADPTSPAGDPCAVVPLPAPGAFIVKAVHQPLPTDPCCPYGPGEDTLDTTLGHAIDLPGLGLTCSSFQGAIVVRRGDPFVDANGLCCVRTEIVAMDMVGTCQDGTPARIRLCPDRRSTGLICQKPENAGTRICFPANSCFSVFFELTVDLPTGPIRFKNCVPAEMCCMIDALPPIGCSYQLQNPPIGLYQVVPGAPLPCAQTGALPPPDGILQNASHRPDDELPPCCPEYGPGEDTLQTTLLHDINIPGLGLVCQANLKGLARVRRGIPYRDPLTGLCCVDVEMVSLDLRGTDPACGEICITLDPRHPSRGRICEKEPRTCFPANSCFDVWVRIELKTLGMVLVSCHPARMCCMIDAIPPINCLYNLDLGSGAGVDTTVPLYQEIPGADVCQVVPRPAPVAEIVRAVHQPVPPCDCFPPAGDDVMDSELSHRIEITGLGIVCDIDLTGPMVVRRGAPYIDPVTGLCCIDTEITSMRLTGVDPVCGPIVVTLCPDRPSRGFICQKPEQDGCFPANSCFDVFIQIELPQLMLVLKNCTPARMCCMIDAIPPFRCLYQLNFTSVPLPLYRPEDCDNLPGIMPVGFIQAAQHTPVEPPKVRIERCEVSALAPNAAAIAWSASPDCQAVEILVNGMVVQTFPGGSGAATVNLPPCVAPQVDVEICVRCLCPDGTSAQACCRLPCPPVPCPASPVVSVDCAVDPVANTVTVHWTLAAGLPENCCAKIIVTQPDGTEVTADPATGSVTLPCQSGRYCVQCEDADGNRSAINPMRHCCEAQCPCPDGISELRCVVQGDQIVATVIPNPAAPAGCCSQYEVLVNGMPLGGPRPIGQNTFTVPCPATGGQLEICVRCVRSDGLVAPLHCCRVSCDPCPNVDPITSVACRESGGIVTIDWTVAANFRPECCREFAITRDGVEIARLGPTARSYSEPCPSAGGHEYCVQCVLADGTLGPRHCCTVVCPCTDPIERIRCSARGNVITVDVIAIAPVDPNCCDNMVVTLDGVVVYNGPRQATLQFDCADGAHTVCVRCVHPDGTAGPEHCCTVICGERPCDPECQTRDCCEPTGCNGVRVCTILPPDQFHFDVYINLESWCNGLRIKACRAQFDLRTAAGGEHMTLQEKCRLLVEAIRTDPDCVAAGYEVVDENCDASPPCFTLIDATCPGAKVVMGISNDPDIFDQEVHGVLPDYEAETITPLCDPTPTDPTDDPAVLVGFSGTPSGVQIVEEMETSTVGVVGRLRRPGMPPEPFRAEIMTMAGMPLDLGPLAERLRMMGIMVEEGPMHLVILNIGSSGQDGLGAGVEPEVEGAAGFTNDDGVHVGNFGGPLDELPIPTPTGVGPFIRGDMNGDGGVPGTTADILYYASWAFLGIQPEPPCLAAADADGDGAVPVVTDIVYLAGFLFLGNEPPPAPYPGCGTSDTENDLELGCETPTCP
jgi:hypothetical protein